MNPIQIHVSTQGNDAWSGQLAEPNAARTDGPLATVRRAQEMIRTLRASGAATEAQVTVWIRGGTYELDEPIRFAGRDSGTADAPVAYAAYPGEAPVLSGGRRITGWRTETVNGRECWVVDLPEVRSGAWTFTQLFVNGERRFRPRLPKTGYYRFSNVEGSTGSGWLQGPREAFFHPEEIRDWKNRDDIKIVALQLWFEAHHRIQALDLANRKVVFRAKSLGSLRDEKGQFARYFVENVFEALTEPGEFYLDRPEGKLYYIPMPGEDMSTAEVIAPRITELVVFAGTPDSPVRHVRLENLAFRHADWDYAPDDPGSIQAAWKVPGAVILEWAEDCVLYGCEVSRVAQYGVDVRTGSAGNRIIACSIFDLGGGGVRIGHEWMQRAESETSKTAQEGRADGRPMETTVSDCEIHHGSRIHYQAVSVWVGNSGRNRIVHNHIHHMNYTGVSCGWTWGYAKTATADNRIEYNHIHHINWDRILSDNGGIYTLGIQPGTTLRGNLIHHIGCYQYGGWGIYPDEGSSEMLIEKNIVHHTDDAGFSTHYGRDNLVRNNIFALARTSHVNPGKLEQHRTTVFERNIVYWQTGGFRAIQWAPGSYLFANNLFWNGRGGDLDLGGGMKLSDWQALGQHQGALVADPLFLDPEAGDFTLRGDTPAKEIGFRPFSLRDVVGPRFRNGTRPTLCEDWPEERLAGPRPIVHTRIDGTAGDRITVTLTNVGQAPARGKVQLRVRPAGALVFVSRPVWTFEHLEPGETRSLEVPVTSRKPIPSMTVETVVSGDGLVPTLEFLGRQQDWLIPRIGALASPGRVRAALSSTSAREVLWARSVVLAKIRMAVAGPDLAVWIRVRDAAVRLATQVWEGSSAEFFVANVRDRLPNPSASDPTKLRQVIIQPPVEGERPARIGYWNGTEVVECPNLRVAGRMVRDGYEVAALLPLEFLRLGAEDDEFLVELVVNTFLVTGGRVTRGTLYGAAAAYCNNAGYGVVKIRPPDAIA